jgi:hypothetical protein
MRGGADTAWIIGEVLGCQSKKDHVYRGRQGAPSVEFQTDPLPLSGVLKVVKRELPAHWQGHERSFSCVPRPGVGTRRPVPANWRGPRGSGRPGGSGPCGGGPGGQRARAQIGANMSFQQHVGSY